MAQIRLVIVSSFLLYREALATLLSAQEDLEVVAAIASAPEQSFSKGTELDAILVDARSIRNQTDVAALRSRFPGTWIVAVSITGTDREAVRCTRSGIDGIIGQEARADEISRVIKEIRNGGFPGSERAAAALFSYVAKGRVGGQHPRINLTPRERDVARLAARSFSNKRIAQELGLEIATVKNNMHNILRKTGLSSRIELAARLRGRAHER